MRLPVFVPTETHYPDKLFQPADLRGKIVATVLSTPELHQMWENELTGMRVRIHEMRHKLADELTARNMERISASSPGKTACSPIPDCLPNRSKD